MGGVVGRRLGGSALYGGDEQPGGGGAAAKADGGGGDQRGGDEQRGGSGQVDDYEGEGFEVDFVVSAESGGFAGQGEAQLRAVDDPCGGLDGVDDVVGVIAEAGS